MEECLHYLTTQEEFIIKHMKIGLVVNHYWNINYLAEYNPQISTKKICFAVINISAKKGVIKLSAR
jgi:hypothetical protein